MSLKHCKNGNLKLNAWDKIVEELRMMGLDVRGTLSILKCDRSIVALSLQLYRVRLTDVALSSFHVAAEFKRHGDIVIYDTTCSFSTLSIGKHYIELLIGIELLRF